MHLTLADGKTIDATEGHPFNTPEGWRDEILRYIERNSKVGKLIPDSIKNHPLNLQPLPKSVHKRMHGNDLEENLPEFNIIQKMWYGSPHCQNSCHPHPHNLNGGKGDNHGTIQCRTQTSNIKQTAIA